MHDTPLNAVLFALVGCGGIGTVSLAHDVPFQRNTTGIRSPVSRSWLDPTATHAVADVHDTSPRPVNRRPDGFGVAWTVQLVPSQRSAKVVLSERRPTAVQALAEVQETAESVPATGGEFWYVDAVPFHLSKRAVAAARGPSDGGARRGRCA